MFDKGSSIIKDASKLAFDYVPVDLINRDEEMEMLEMLMRPIVTSGTSETAFVTGTVGSGKTATVRRFGLNMAEYCSKNNIPFGFELVNCRQKSSDSSILAQLIKRFDPNFPDKGFSPADMLQILRKHIVKSGMRMLIVLDEVDSLIKRGSTDLIYQFTRFNDNEIGKVSLSLILISQEYVLDRIDTASLSSFKRANTVRFRKYTKADLVSILEARARMAIIDECYDDDVIDFIADIASETSDARVAIELLDKSARIAETKTLGVISAEDVRGAKDLMYSLVSESKLRALSMNKLLTLLAVARCIKNKPYISLPAAEKTYAVVCEEYEVPARKHTQFASYITGLERDGFIKTVKRSDPGLVGGATTNISLPDVPAVTLAKMIEEIMEGFGEYEV